MDLRLIADRDDLRGTHYFEFLPRPHGGACWQADSVYVAEPAVCLFDDLLRAHVPGYSPAAFSEADGRAAAALADALRRRANAGRREDDPWELLIAWDAGERGREDFVRRWPRSRDEAVALLGELADWIARSVPPGGTLSVLGM